MSSGNSVLVFESYSRLNDALLAFQQTTSSRFLTRIKDRSIGQTDWNKILSRKKFKVRWESEKDTEKAPVIDFNSSPYIHGGRLILNCHFEKDYHACAKARYIENRDRRMLEDNVQIKTRKCPPSKKRGCPAQIYVNQIVRFPDIQIKKNTKTFRNMGAKHLRTNFNNLQGKVLYYVRFPDDNEHKYHPEIVENSKSMKKKTSQPKSQEEEEADQSQETGKSSILRSLFTSTTLYLENIESYAQSVEANEDTNENIESTSETSESFCADNQLLVKNENDEEFLQTPENIVSVMQSNLKILTNLTNSVQLIQDLNIQTKLNEELQSLQNHLMLHVQEIS